MRGKDSEENYGFLTFNFFPLMCTNKKRRDFFYMNYQLDLSF